MRAARIHALNTPLVVEDLPESPVPEGWVRILTKAAALNRRDFWMTKGMYPGIQLPVTPGSDGAGLMGEREVVIDPGLYWGASEDVQSKDFQILGMPTEGTCAEQIILPLENIYDKPGHMSWEEAAAFPLAGVTAYRALFRRGALERGQKVLITGVGGGVALMAMQLAMAAGAEVCVTSGNAEKLRRAGEMGASCSVNYNTDEWEKSVLKDFGECDLVIDSAGGQPFSRLPKLVRPGGRIVLYGGTLGKIQDLSPQVLFWRQISIHGTSMGSPADFRAMLDFVHTHKIHPVVDHVYPLEQINEAIHALETGSQFGKVVVRIS